MSEDEADRDAREKRTVLVLQSEDDARRAELAKKLSEELGRRAGPVLAQVAQVFGVDLGRRPAEIEWALSRHPSRVKDSDARQLEAAQARRNQRASKRLRALSQPNRSPQTLWKTEGDPINAQTTVEEGRSDEDKGQAKEGNVEKEMTEEGQKTDGAREEIL